MVTVRFLFHGELNVFLAPALRRRVFLRGVPAQATVKHAIESLGVPHTEVGAILLNRRAVGLSACLGEGAQVEVHPACMAAAFSDASFQADLHPPLSAPARFVADAHLGKLARYLRMFGFDVLYRNDYSDAEIADLASREQRIVLTRDRDLLMRKGIVHGRYLHALDAEHQVAEILHRFRLASEVHSFTRCLVCNGVLHAAAAEEVAHLTPPQSRALHVHFTRCSACCRVYWEGSHMQRMRARVARIERIARSLAEGRIAD